MVIGVIGSRDFENARKVVFDTLARVCGSKNVEGIVSGGARGPDKLGAEYARKHSIPVIEHLPDWDKHGRSAGYIRNADIVRDSTIILAFYDGTSSGTKHSMTLAHEAGKKVYVVDSEGNMDRWTP